MQRLDKVLSHAGAATRSEAKKLAKSGALTVNGKVVTDPGYKVDPGADTIAVNGEPVRYRPYLYLMMNKPAGVVSATEDLRERTVLDLLTGEERHYEPFPVGRLDKDTEGLLLISSDGKLAHALLSPRRHVPKTYQAQVEGKVDAADVEAFRQGVVLEDGYRTLPAELQIAAVRASNGSPPLSDVQLVITEGKFHQVKRMFQAVGKRVVYLKRIAMGPLLLDERLEPGQYRELTEEEIDRLKGETDGH